MRPSPRLSRQTMTVEQWGRLGEDEPGELVDGLIEEEEVPSFLHELIVLWFASRLDAWLEPQNGCALGSELKLAIGPRRGRKPDVNAYLPGSPRPSLTAPVVRVPPDIVVEVLSPAPKDQKRDRLDKLADYARAGVRWYWIVDPQLRALQIFELARSGRYLVAQSGSTGTLKPQGCRGLTLDLDELWRRVDREAARAGK